jgi:c-di-AMP phosphodiesterase-like protein
MAHLVEPCLQHPENNLLVNENILAEIHKVVVIHSSSETNDIDHILIHYMTGKNRKNHL